MSPLAHLPLPEPEQLETRAVLKMLATAHRYLAELKGVAASIPNENILISTLTLQEAKDSSAVENIITTHDELYKAELITEQTSIAAKEVRDYSAALRQSFAAVRKQKLIRLNDVLDVQLTLENNRAGFRKVPGTALKNAATGEVIYTPPQDANEVQSLMENLVNYINDDQCCELDPLVKMALIHHQFESIHPFYDGNGRTGRIINILYLVAKGLLDLPVLYLSRYIIRHKADYYHHLQSVRDTGDWQPWLLFILKGIAETAQQTIGLIQQIKQQMGQVKHDMRTQLPNIYRQELLNNIFSHPYTKIDFVMQDLSVSRITATKYLEQLVEHGFLVKEKMGRSNYYINQPLFALFAQNEVTEY
ncbi:Fic family protein [Shewanella surugensis]|uniref:Protein adenylyltransferase n=1 Tax=Shewanella surugensis TaxID=212020 RepID=A0ABT0LH73_9GAMM|nr:Fic family protein [Shewanella surugensis]MCL1126657.1 Fic family protein [Shewanella surugensis]